MTSDEQLGEWLSQPEGARLEFKTASNAFHFEKLVDYCVALANEGGGKIILGVTDRRPRQLVGTSAFSEPGRTEAGLYERLGHRIPVEEYHTKGKRLLIFHVPSRLQGTAWQHKGRYLRRAGDDVVSIPDNDLRSIFAETGPDFSAETSAGTMHDLLPEALNDFRRRWARRSGNERAFHWNDEELLAKAELLVDGRITFAGLILFGSRAALGRHLGQSEIVFEYRSSEAAGPAQDRVEYREGFFSFHEALWEKINLRNDRQSYQEGLFRYDIGEFIDFEERWTGAYIFENEWQSFRTRQNRELELTSASHLYPSAGNYTIAIKVIDIFGNDTMTLIKVRVG
jgi:ATP-dependent DNA helicase RecG